MRILAALLVMTAAMAQPSAAGLSSDAMPDGYSPMDGKGLGYKDKMTKDGYWRIDVGSRLDGTSRALDIAIRRAAVLAQDSGYRYVQLHDAFSSTTETVNRVELFARGTDALERPAKCRSGKPERCYTADGNAILHKPTRPAGYRPELIFPRDDKSGQDIHLTSLSTRRLGG